MDYFLNSLKLLPVFFGIFIFSMQEFENDKSSNNLSQQNDTFQVNKITLIDCHNKKFELNEIDLRNLKVIKDLIGTSGDEIDLRKFKLKCKALYLYLNKTFIKEMVKVINEEKLGRQQNIEKLYELIFIADFLGIENHALRNILKKIRRQILNTKNYKVSVKKSVIKELKRLWKFHCNNFKNLKLNIESCFDPETGVLDLSDCDIDSLYFIKSIPIYRYQVKKFLLNNNKIDNLNIKKLLKLFPNLKKLSVKDNELMKIKLPGTINGKFKLNVKNNLNYKIEHPALIYANDIRDFKYDFSNNKQFSIKSQAKLHFALWMPKFIFYYLFCNFICFIFIFALPDRGKPLFYDFFSIEAVLAAELAFLILSGIFLIPNLIT